MGKYGPQVVALLNKAASVVGLDNIKMLCPLHGPIWRKDLGYIIDKYTHWATYEPEEKGVMIVYASMYGNTPPRSWPPSSRPGASPTPGSTTCPPPTSAT